MDTGIDNMEDVRAIDLSNEELKKAYEYYKYWYDFMKSTKIKSLSEEEIEWFNELKEEHGRRMINND